MLTLIKNFSFYVIIFLNIIILIIFLINFFKYFIYYYKFYLKQFFYDHFDKMIYFFLIFFIISYTNNNISLCADADNIISNYNPNFNIYPENLANFLNTLEPIIINPKTYIRNSLDEITDNLIILGTLLEINKTVVISENSIANAVLEIYQNIDLYDFEELARNALGLLHNNQHSITYINDSKINFYIEHLIISSYDINRLITPLLTQIQDSNTESLTRDELANCYHLCKDLFDGIEGLKVKPENINLPENLYSISQQETNYNLQLEGLQQQIWSLRGELISIDSSDGNSLSDGDDNF